MIIVTGGTGFIGSNLVAAIAERGGDEVVVCDRLGTGDKWRNIAKHEVADILPPEGLLDFLGRHVSGVRAIFHMGAISATTERDADLIIRSNFTLTKELWGWCSAHRCRLIYASSAATYGDGSHGFDDDGSREALARLRPLNAYGWSKHLFDRRVASWMAEGNARPPQWAGLKFFNVYGPNEYHKGDMQSVIAKAYPLAARGETVTLFKSHHPDYEDGGQLRDFISVRDCVAVMLWLLDHPEVNGLFNVGTGQARSFKDLVTAVFRAVGRAPDIRYVDTPVEIREKYQYFTQAKMERLRAAGYAKPPLSLEEGVLDYVQNYLSKPDPYR